MGTESNFGGEEIGREEAKRLMDDADELSDKHPEGALDKGIKALELSGGDNEIRQQLSNMARYMIRSAKNSGGWGSEEGKQEFIDKASKYL